MMKFWIVTCMAVALLAAGVSLAGNPHPPGCKGDPHACIAPTTATVTAPAQTVTVATPAPPAVQVVTVQAPAAPASAPASATSTVTVVIPPSATRTILRVKVRNVRRYCTRQRHGWRCYAKRPPYAPHH